MSLEIKTMMHLYVEKLTAQNLSNATITRRLASIRCFYQFLMQYYHIAVNPAKHIKLEKSPKKLPHFLSGTEIDLLLAQPNIDEPKGCRDKAILELLYATGIRATELVELNLEDINFQTIMKMYMYIKILILLARFYLINFTMMKLYVYQVVQIITFVPMSLIL